MASQGRGEVWQCGYWQHKYSVFLTEGKLIFLQNVTRGAIRLEITPRRLTHFDGFSTTG